VKEEELFPEYIYRTFVLKDLVAKT